jgi:hypothetical protein
MSKSVHFVHFAFTSDFWGEVNSRTTAQRGDNTVVFTSFTSFWPLHGYTPERPRPRTSCMPMHVPKWSERSEHAGVTPEPSVDLSVHFTDISEVNRSERSEREVLMQ